MVKLLLGLLMISHVKTLPCLVHSEYSGSLIKKTMNTRSDRSFQMQTTMEEETSLKQNKLEKSK
jgi:hypothetical protein